MELLVFILKKLASAVFLPVPAIFLLCLAGFLLWRKKSSSRWGPRLVGLALVAWLVLSLPLTGWLLLRPLEISAGGYAQPARLSAAGVRHVVVLSGGVWPGKRTPGDCLGGASLRRLLEGIRLWRGIPGAKLVLSGGNSLPGQSEGKALANLAIQLGVPQNDLVLEETSWDTAGQGEQLASLLKGRKFALVTSASHLPRSLLEFKKHGLEPLPAPADFRTKGLEFSWRTLIPQATGLAMVRSALHEYMGLAWFWLKSLAA